MIWRLVTRTDPRAVAIADRHYSRQKVGALHFVPPGRSVVLLAPDALWATSWPKYAQHAWAGAWINSLFRNESNVIASTLIRQAIAATRAVFGEPPEQGMITFIDPRYVKPTPVRGQKVYGWTYRKAGFHPIGETAKGLLVFQLLPAEMPEPEPPERDRFVFKVSEP